MYKTWRKHNRITQRKGDAALTRAAATFTVAGADVLFPITESAAYDLVVDFYGKLKRVQVRFCSDREVGLRRIHSNSKGYVVKRPKENAYDWLYVLNGNGEEFLITYSLTGRSTVSPQRKDLLTNVLSKIIKTEGWQSGLMHLS